MGGEGRHHEPVWRVVSDSQTMDSSAKMEMKAHRLMARTPIAMPSSAITLHSSGLESGQVLVPASEVR